MNENDLLVSRLNLLVIMAKAQLKYYPMGDFRKRAVLENARSLFHYARTKTYKVFSVPSTESVSQESSRNISDFGYLFMQRSQLLAVMMYAFAKGKAKGSFREKAMAENIEKISLNFASHSQIGNVQFLKVA